MVFNHDNEARREQLRRLHEAPGDEAREAARQADFRRAAANFQLPDGEACVGDSLCRCGRCVAAFGAN